MTKLMSLDEASQLMGVPYASLRKFALEEETKAGTVRIGRRIYLNRSIFMDYIKDKGEETKES